MSGAARRERARSRPETHAKSSDEGARAPLTAERCPSAPATPRGAAPASRGTSAPPKGAERAAVPLARRSPCREWWELGWSGKPGAGSAAGRRG